MQARYLQLPPLRQPLGFIVCHRTSIIGNLNHKHDHIRPHPRQPFSLPVPGWMRTQDITRIISWRHILPCTVEIPRELHHTTSLRPITMHHRTRTRIHTRTRTRPHTQSPCRHMSPVNTILRTTNNSALALSVTRVYCRTPRCLAIVLFQSPMRAHPRPRPTSPRSRPIIPQPCITRQRCRRHSIHRKSRRLRHRHHRCRHTTPARSVSTKP